MAQRKINTDLRKKGKTWLDRVRAAGKRQKQWMDDAAKAEKAYTNEQKVDGEITSDALGVRYDFNILYANVETIVPAVINSPPVPDIRRRFNDPDPVARIVADLMERAIRVQIDDSRLQVELEGAAQDAFLSGRGIVRIRFKSEIKGGETTDDELKDAADDVSEVRGEEPAPDDGEGDGYGREQPANSANGQPQYLENERICFEAVSWKDYRHGPAKRWEDRPWEAYRFCIAREDQYSSFNEDLIRSQLDDNELKSRGESDDDLTGWEIWDKKDRRVCFVDDDGVVLKEIDDPLGLAQFYPIPQPMQPVEIVGRLTPVNPFSIYRKLADELDTITKRINALVDNMRVRGWYAGTAKELENIIQLNDNEFTPVAEPEIWAQNGGLDGAIAFWPIEKFIVVIKELYVAREQTKQAIYEITGISDIVRGQAKATETATAQNIKSQWGSLRIQKMQRMLERHARDLFVMMSEIIPSKFSRQTMEQMTGIPILPQPTDTPEQLQQKMKINQLLDQRLASYYRIDVESDSTIRADLTRQKQEVSEFLQGAGAYFQAVMPLVQEGALSEDAAVDIFAATARMFNLGKSVEDTLEKMVADAKMKAQQPKKEKPDPEAIKAQSEQAKLELQSQQVQMKAQADQAAAAAQVQIAQAKLQADLAKIDADVQAKSVEGQIKLQESQAKIAADQQTHQLEMEKGKLELAKIMAEIEKIKVGTAATVDQANAKAEQNKNENDAKAKQQQTADNGNQAITQLTEMMGQFIKASSAEKRIVRDPKTGKATGVQTVQADG